MRTSSRIHLFLLILFSPILVSLGRENDHCYTDTDKDYVITWGQETNGYSAGVQFVPSNRHEFRFEVFVRRSKTSTWVKTNLMAGPLYLGASNRFCGPIELRDVNGNVVPMLKPNLSAATSYPSTLSWSSFFNRNAYSGSVVNICSFGDKEREPIRSLGSFQFSRYYNVTNTSVYQFKVIPIIYLKSVTNEDIYNRIDIPPVTAGVRFSGVTPETQYFG